MNKQIRLANQMNQVEAKEVAKMNSNVNISEHIVELVKFHEQDSKKLWHGDEEAYAEYIAKFPKANVMSEENLLKAEVKYKNLKIFAKTMHVDPQIAEGAIREGLSFGGVAWAAKKCIEDYKAYANNIRYAVKVPAVYKELPKLKDADTFWGCITDDSKPTTKVCLCKEHWELLSEEAKNEVLKDANGDVVTDEEGNPILIWKPENVIDLNATPFSDEIQELFVKKYHSFTSANRIIKEALHRKAQVGQMIINAMKEGKTITDELLNEFYSKVYC